MTVTLTLMDGRTISVPVDSASTSGEICQMLSQKVQLKDSFGFSVYVALYEKVSACLEFWNPTMGSHCHHSAVFSSEIFRRTV
jgi:hypothetical protein